MPSPVTRIFSDLHFGDRASQAKELAQLRPLLDGVAAVVLNGDTIDTRPGPAATVTAELRATVDDFFRRQAPPTTLLTGNHDPDISEHHSLDLADGRVLAVHGDILFENIVPWGADAPRLGALIAAELTLLGPAQAGNLRARLGAWRRAALRVPQRHQSERNGLKYALSFAADTFWPPLRLTRIFRAWHEEPRRAAALLRQHRPDARFVLLGHTHRPGWWRLPEGAIAINTGSFCPPLGGFVTDLTPERLTIRRVERRGREFHPGRTVVEFPLAAA